jgi:hypothetical protein
VISLLAHVRFWLGRVLLDFAARGPDRLLFALVIIPIEMYVLEGSFRQS